MTKLIHGHIFIWYKKVPTTLMKNLIPYLVSLLPYLADISILEAIKAKAEYQN